jgi:hypothetical protein
MFPLADDVFELIYDSLTQPSTKPEDGLSDNHGAVDDLMAMLTAGASMTDDCEQGISHEKHDPAVVDRQT